MSLPFAVQEREQLTNARVWFSSMFPGDHTARRRRRRPHDPPPPAAGPAGADAAAGPA